MEKIISFIKCSQIKLMLVTALAFFIIFSSAGATYTISPTTPKYTHTLNSSLYSQTSHTYDIIVPTGYRFINACFYITNRDGYHGYGWGDLISNTGKKIMSCSVEEWGALYFGADIRNEMESSKNIKLTFTLSTRAKKYVYYVPTPYGPEAHRAPYTDSTSQVIYQFEVQYEEIIPATMYTVSFNANGGSVSSSTRSVKKGASIGALPTPTRSGYTFDGWYTSASGGTKITSSQIITGNVTYYAHWTAISSKPDLSPYTPSDWASSMVLNTSSSTRSTTKTSFKDTDTIYVSFSFACYNKNISSKFYTILYVDGVAQQTWHTDGLNAQKTAYVNYYELKNLAPGSHTIKLVIDSKDTISESNESNNSISRTITISETVKKYTVKFNKNDGSGLTSSRSFISGQSQQLPWIGSGFNWSRSGYDFVGWSTYASATSASYNNGANVYNLASAGGSITLYAVWKTKGYTIRFNKNDGSGTTTSRNFAYGQSQTLPWIGSGLGWSRSGYDFVGWSTYASATSASYNNGANVYNLTSAGGSITLYAVWKTKGYTIRFNKNDGSGTTTSRNFAYGQSQTLPWIGSGLGWSRSGYDFVGWSTYASATSASYNNGANVYNLASTGGSITLYAVWKTKGYTIRFNKNDGSGTTTSRNFAYGQSQTLPWIGSGLGWSRSGYNFLGWNTYSSATTARYANGAKLTDLIASGVSLTLYAVWALPSNAYLVRFHGFLPPGKTGTPPTATRVYIAGVKYQLPWVNGELGWNPGYTFLGWERYNDSECSLYKNGETIVLSSIAGVEIDLYSVWDDYDWNAPALGYGIKTGSMLSDKADDKTNTTIYGTTENGGIFQLSLKNADTGNIFIYDETTLLESTCTITYTTTGMLITFGEHALAISEEEEMPVATWIY